MNKKVMLNILADYFILKGKVLSKREYMHEKDTPIRHAIITRIFSWSRIENMIKRNCPEKYEEILNSVTELPKKQEVTKVPSSIFKKGD